MPRPLVPLAVLRVMHSFRALGPHLRSSSRWGALQSLADAALAASASADARTGACAGAGVSSKSQPAALPAPARLPAPSARIFNGCGNGHGGVSGGAGSGGGGGGGYGGGGAARTSAAAAAAAAAAALPSAEVLFCIVPPERSPATDGRGLRGSARPASAGEASDDDAISTVGATASLGSGPTELLANELAAEAMAAEEMAAEAAGAIEGTMVGECGHEALASPDILDGILEHLLRGSTSGGSTSGGSTSGGSTNGGDGCRRISGGSSSSVDLSVMWRHASVASVCSLWRDVTRRVVDRVELLPRCLAGHGWAIESETMDEMDSWHTVPSQQVYLGAGCSDVAALPDGKFVLCDVRSPRTGGQTRDSLHSLG